MASSPSEKGLSLLQREVLEQLFQREKRFFLSGGAALVGFYLHHRSTSDLDLFTTEADAMEGGRRAVRDTAAKLGAALEVRGESESFFRAVLERGDEAVVIDLNWDPIPQRYDEKEVRGAIVVDRLEEILVNNLTTLVSRREERDLVDVYCIERAGLRVEEALEPALAKDGGCTPATLAWLLPSFPIPEAERLPPDVDHDELAKWRDELVRRLRKCAFPHA